jgi:hypothetical protein
MGTWNWKQPSGKMYKVISDYKKGTIIVYDDKGNLLMAKKNLSKKAIRVVEENFLGIVTKDDNKRFDDTNPMYA